MGFRWSQDRLRTRNILRFEGHDVLNLVNECRLSGTPSSLNCLEFSTYMELLRADSQHECDGPFPEGTVLWAAAARLAARVFAMAQLGLHVESWKSQARPALNSDPNLNRNTVLTPLSHPHVSLYTTSVLINFARIYTRSLEICRKPSVYTSPRSRALCLSALLGAKHYGDYGDEPALEGVCFGRWCRSGRAC